MVIAGVKVKRTLTCLSSRAVIQSAIPRRYMFETGVVRRAEGAIHGEPDINRGVGDRTHEFQGAGDRDDVRHATSEQITCRCWVRAPILQCWQVSVAATGDDYLVAPRAR